MTTDKGILIRNIYYMLTYAFQDLRRNNYEDIAGEDFDNILDLFAEILFKSISFQLKRGLHKDYVSHSDNLTAVKGKIDIGGSIKLRIQRKQQLLCNFDEFSENNLHNRILKSTVKLLIQSKGVNTKRRKALRSLLLFFSQVDDCDLKSIRWADITYDRNTATYKMLHHFCYFVVQKLLLTTDTGQYRVMTFDEELMSRLYEKFVLSFYRHHYPQYSARAARVEWNIDSDTSSLSIIPDLQTDITLTFPGRKLIIDTKYYGQSMQHHMGKAAIHSQNLFQIHTYVVNEDKAHAGNVDGLLLYAKTQEALVPDGQMNMSDGNTIYFRTLDLNQDFEGIKNQLAELIEPYIQP